MSLSRPWPTVSRKLDFRPRCVDGNRPEVKVDSGSDDEFDRLKIDLPLSSLLFNVPDITMDQ